VCVCVCVRFNALCRNQSDGESSKGVELSPIWPEFDPRKDGADGRKDGFNGFVPEQLDPSWGSFGLSSCSSLTHTLF